MTKAPFVLDHTTKSGTVEWGDRAGNLAGEWNQSLHCRRAGGRQDAEHAGQRTRSRPL